MQLNLAPTQKFWRQHEQNEWSAPANLIKALGQTAAMDPVAAIQLSSEQSIDIEESEN